MREPFASMLATRAGKLALSLLLASPHIITPTTAYNFTSIPSPNLNLDDLGRVAFAGEFDSISVYQFEGQSERSSGDKGALLSRYPTGAFANINNTDADIKAMCAYQTRDGERVVFAGNFTSVGGLHTPGGIALLNPYDGTVEPLEGLNGSVNALFCDRGRGQVYVGGSFTGSNSSNALIWKDDWIDMPFEGFNGPVFSITQAPNDKIVFGGLFNGLGGGNASGSTAENITQIIPISSANISAQTSSGRPGFTQPSDIVCKDNLETQGADQTWLLSDNVAGFWKADFGFGFEPSKLRLYNTDFEGRGTKTWRYTALPDGGIMNFTFIDPATGQQSFCDARCPLPQGNTSAQDFTFVNTVGMNSFRIDISDWYGSGGGLNGIQLFQNETFAWAIDDFNAPRCGGPVTGAQSTATGPWLNTPSHDSNAQYLTAVLQGDNIQPDAATVVFQPEIKQSGNYSVTIYTPGCIGDGTCGTRGRVNVTGAMAADRPTSTVLFQTNDFDKYDEIYYGFIDATNGFRPTVTLAPAAGQSGILTMVAQRVRFSIKNATSGDLNGLFEYDTSLQEGAQIDLSSSVINSAGVSLNPRSRALVTTLAADNDRLYVGGNFSSGDGRNNIFAIGRDATSPTALSGNGLNSQVMALYQNDTTLYVGGNFTNTEDNNAQGLNGLAAYSNNQWTPIGAGVNGVVMYIVPFSLNLTAGNPVQVLGISGFFDRVNRFDNNPAFDVEGFAIWIPSQNNWLNNLNISSISVRGKLMTHTDVPGSDPWFGGSVSSGTLGADGAVVLNDDDMSLQSFPAAIRAQQQQSALRKRAIADSQNLTSTGILAATFYKENGMNKTILAGHFSATGSDNQNITNVMIIDGKDSDKVTGFDGQVAANSTFGALAVQDNILYAGGVVSGQLDGNTRIGGVVAYDLSGNAFASIQPPALQGTNVTVNAIAPRPKSKDVFIAGRFESAGALSCPALCVWNTERNQWTNPGGDIRGIVSALTWVSDTKLFITGNLTTGNNQTKVLSYDSSTNEFLEIAGANDLPGPVTALTPATSDGNQVWASGQTADGSAFLQRFDGEKWLPVNDLFGEGTIIRGIQVLTLSDPHGESDLIDRGQDLLLLGQINVTNFGTASGVLFNGTALIPILLSTTAEDTAGTLSQVFVENPQFFLRNSKKHLALGFIVLIALGIALALTFLLVVAGIVIEWYRKKAKGYSPAPTNYPDRLGNVGRVPPEQLFGTLRGPGAPTV